MPAVSQEASSPRAPSTETRERARTPEPRRPRTTAIGSDPVAGLSAARVRVLELLDEAGGPATISTLAERSGYHPNTLREHLHALIEAGLVRSTSGTVRGRGRPPIVYETIAAEGARPQLRAYASLASALARHISTTSADPAAEALEAGREWGRTLAGSREIPLPQGPDPVTWCVRLLTHLGFSSTRAGNVIELASCPFLAAATADPAVVCNVHQGLLQGYVRSLSPGTPLPQLRPFGADHGCEVLFS